VLIMKFMFTYIPKAAPFFIRFVLRGIFNQIDKVLVEPELKRHGAMVRLLMAPLRNQGP
jgi:glutathione S-transferase